MSVDYLLDEDTGEVLANEKIDGDAVTSLAQRLRVRLRTFKGEQFTNIDTGIDYYGVVFVKKYDQQAIDLAFRTEILKEDGVSYIEYINYSPNFSTRTLSITLKVIESTTGESVEVVI